MNPEDDEPEELADIDEAEFAADYLRIVNRMLEEKSWYFVEGLYKGLPLETWQDVKFSRVTEKCILALGRSDYYDRFIEDFTKRESKNIYQSDYMLWIDPSDPYKSLLYYIDTAEEIHFSLEGVSPNDFRLAIEKRCRATDRRDLGSPFMTVWEINQVLYSEALNKTVWYCSGEFKVNDFANQFNDHGIGFRARTADDFSFTMERPVNQVRKPE